jgi:O-antigen/teichoic acid export membrane protein
MYKPTWIKKSEFAGNVSKLVAGTALGQLITILVSPILTRLYSADDFGILAVYFSISSILSVIISLRFEMAIVLPDEEEEAIDLVLLGLILSFLLSFIILLIFMFLQKEIVTLIGHPEIGLYLYFVPLSTLFYGSYQVLSYWMSRIKQFKDLAVSKTVKETGMAGIQLSMGWIIYTGAMGLITGQIAGNAFATGVLLIKSYKQIKKRLLSDLVINLKNIFYKYKKFPVYTSWATLINSLSQNIPALLLAVFFLPATAGYYAIATRVLTVPSILIGNSVRQVYYQQASSLYNEGKSIFKLYKKVTTQLGLLAIIPTGVLILFGKPLFEIIFGLSWGEAGIFASILALWLFFGFMNPPAMVTVFILEINQLHLIWEFLLLIFRILAIYIGYAIFDNLYYSIGLFSLVGVVFNLFLIATIYFKLKKL